MSTLLLYNIHKCEIVSATLLHEDYKIIISSLFINNYLQLALQNLVSILKDIAHANPSTPIWIGGDLPNIEWSTISMTDNHYPITPCDQLLGFVIGCGYLEIVQSPTRNTNILDIFLTSQPLLIEHCEVMPGISDHEIISVTSLTSITDLTVSQSQEMSFCGIRQGLKTSMVI